MSTMLHGLAWIWSYQVVMIRLIPIIGWILRVLKFKSLHGFIFVPLKLSTSLPNNLNDDNEIAISYHSYRDVESIIFSKLIDY